MNAIQVTAILGAALIGGAAVKGIKNKIKSKKTTPAKPQSAAFPHFVELYDSIDHKLTFDPAWKNGTGYFDPLTRMDLGLKAGEMATSVDEHGRRMIIVGTPLGNVVAFERYVPGDAGVVVHNAPAVLNTLLRGSSLSEETFVRYFNQFTNIGMIVKMITEANPEDI